MREIGGRVVLNSLPLPCSPLESLLDHWAVSSSRRARDHARELCLFMLDVAIVLTPADISHLPQLVSAHSRFLGLFCMLRGQHV
jgi:hypothetical protein